MNVSGSTIPLKSNSSPATDLAQSSQVVETQTADAQGATRITEKAKRWQAAHNYLDSLKAAAGSVGAAVAQAAQAAIAQAIAAANAQAAATALTQAAGAARSGGSISATGQTGSYLARLNTLTASNPAVSPRNHLLDLATERSQYTQALVAMGDEGDSLQLDDLRKYRLDLQPLLQPVSAAAGAERQFTIEMFPQSM